MGLLLRLGVIAAVLGSGWWWLAATALDRGAERALAELRRSGWQAELAPGQTTGFPLTLQRRFEGLTLSEARSGSRFETPWLDLSAPSYWPGNLRLTFPPEQMILGQGNALVGLTVTEGQMDLHLHPGPALALEKLTMQSGAWQLEGAPGMVARGRGLDLRLVQDPDQDQLYLLSFEEAALTPGPALRGLLGLPESWPESFDRFSAALQVGFDRPLDRHALPQGQSPQPRSLDLRQLDLHWGRLRAKGTGALTLDATGLPEGTLELEVENWREMLQLAEEGGALPPSQRSQAELMLGALANMGGGGPDILRLTLRFDGGEMFLGPILLGPAPRIIL